nr:MAG TPA: Matrixin [Caudoviricetes sp.]
MYNVILVWISLCFIHVHEYGHAISILSTLCFVFC